MTSDLAAPKRNALAVLTDIIIAPSAAFESLKIRPAWFIAFVVTSVLGMIGGYLQSPAGQHITAYVFAHDPRFATMSPDSVHAAEKMGVVVQKFIWIAWPLFTIIAIFFATLFLLIGNAIGKGSGSFAKLFSLAANVSIIQFGIGYLLTGIIATIRGPEGIVSPGDLLGLLPNLGMLLPGAPTQVHVFFAAITIAQLWSVAVLALGFRAIANVAPAIAWGTPIVMMLASATYAALTIH